MAMLRSCVFLVLLIAVAVAQMVNVTDLHFVLMVSGRDGAMTVEQNTAGVVPAVNMALEQINAATILPGYRLRYTTLLDTTCVRNVSLEEFFADIRSQPPARLFVIGCGCSIATEPVAEISHFWEVVMMSYSSMSPMLSDRVRFPNYYRTVPEALGLSTVLMTTLDYYGWRRLVVVSQEENVFSLVLDRIVDSFSQRSNSSLGVVRFRSDKNIADKNELFNQTDDIRIYFLNMFPKHARRVLCASTMPSATVASSAPTFSYPNFIWITLDWYPSRWWTAEVAGNDPTVNCTDQQFEQLLNQSLVIAQYPQAENISAKTDVRMTRAEFNTEYRNRLLADNTSSNTFAAPFAYDALWSMAFALNRSNPEIEFIRNDQRNLSLEVIRQLEDLQFSGVTGPVSFNDGNRVETSPRVLQYRFEVSTLVQVEIAKINVSNVSAQAFVFVYNNGENNDTTWPLNSVPLDGSPLIRLEAILLPLFIVFAILATGGLIMVCFFVGFNVVFRNRKVIRLTSPNLNYIILLGCAMMYISIYFYVIPVFSDDVRYGTCIVRAFAQSVGCVLLFGTISCKMGRVFFIFRNLSPSKKKRTIHDWQLLLIILAMASAMAVYVSIWLGVDEYGPLRVPDNERVFIRDEYNVTVQFENLVCDSPRSTFWIAVIFLGILSTVISAFFFAIATRKVRIKTLNDTKEVSIIIYITTAIWLILLICVFLLDQFLNADAGVFSFGLFLFATITQLLLFIPKVVGLIKDPKGEYIFERSNSQPSFMSGNNLDTVDREKMSAMTVRIKELEERLKKHEPVTPFVFRRRFNSASNVLDTTVDSTRRSRTTSAAPLITTDVQQTSLNANVSASYKPRMIVSQLPPPKRTDSTTGSETPFPESTPDSALSSPTNQSPTGKGSCDDLLTKEVSEKSEQQQQQNEVIGNGTKKHLTFSEV